MGVEPLPVEGDHNIFFAVVPPEGVRGLICRFRDNLCHVHGLKGRPVPRECLHISLHPFGFHDHLPAHEVEMAANAGIAAARQTASFDVSLNRVLSWRGNPGRRPLVLLGDEGVFGLDRLRGTLHEALADASLTKRSFEESEPHLTLLRGDNDFPDTIVLEIRWTVRELVLIDSRVGEGRHDILARWPLTH